VGYIVGTNDYNGIPAELKLDNWPILFHPFVKLEVCIGLGGLVQVSENG
jgi:hypothetical protein